MVDQFDNCEFWLPPEFLSDDEIDTNLKKSGNEEIEDKKEGVDLFSGFGSSSEMGSPVESVVGSNESESDEEDFINGLSRKMADATLDGNSYAYQNNKAWKLSSSPKSPLCNAAGEFARKKMVQERKKMVQESGGGSGVLPSRTEPLVPVEQPGPNFGFPTTPPQQLAYQQLQAVRFEHLRRHQMMNQTQQTRGVKNGERMPIGLPGSAWPPLQRSQQKPQPGTGMTAVFLGNNLDVAKKQCAGTGVFLPRTESSTGNLKNKPAYSPVLIPDKVIQALNLNLETLGVQNQARLRPGCFNNNGFSADHGAALKYINENKKNHVMVQQSQSIAGPEPENQEVIRLPAEWTY